MNIMALIIMLAFLGCATPHGEMSVRPSNLTPGMVKKQVIVGKTDQAEIMEIFGPPDLITKKGDYEMWGYDKISREAAYTAFGMGVGGGGAVGAGGLGGLAGFGTGYGTQSTKTIFLLIYFDQKNIVSDYKLSATRF
jgi:outer membrane protein assembly factor BamE (lipoprotein component of BamABCDE complex)